MSTPMTTAERRAIPDRLGEMELTTGDGISLEAPRHLWLGADLLDPARRRDINLPQGGEEIASPCLVRTGGLLPRCEITMLELWGQPLPIEFFPENVRAYSIRGNGPQAPVMPAGEVGGMAAKLTGSPLFMLPVFPGEQIVDIIGIPTGETRGVVEIEVLRGQDHATARAMQDLFFPADWPLPIALRLVEEQIMRVADSVADADVKSAAANMLQSTAQSREYMLSKIAAEDTQVAMRVHPKGHVYRYSPKGRSFAAQLEIKLMGPGERVMEQVGKAVEGIGMEQLVQLQAAGYADLGKVIAEAVTAAINAVAQRPVAEPPAVPPTDPAKPTKAK